MSAYQHSVCDECFQKRSSRLPFRLVNPQKSTCCFCGKEHRSGIGVMENPANTLCKGVHTEPAVSAPRQAKEGESDGR